MAHFAKNDDTSSKETESQNKAYNVTSGTETWDNNEIVHCSIHSKCANEDSEKVENTSEHSDLWARLYYVLIGVKVRLFRI